MRCMSRIIAERTMSEGIWFLLGRKEDKGVCVGFSLKFGWYNERTFNFDIKLKITGCSSPNSET